MTKSGDPNEPRPGREPREDRTEEGKPAWWSEGQAEREEPPPEPRPYESGPTGGDETPPGWSAGGPPGAGPTGGTAPEEEPAPGEPTIIPAPGEEPPGREEEEPIAPAPPTVPRPDVPPTHEPRPGGEPEHPDLPTAPEIPEPAEGDAGTTQAYPIPGATPPYPGWEGAPKEEGPGRPTPSRYEQPRQGAHGEQPPFTPYGTYAAPSQEPPVVPGTTPSSPYGGPPGYGPPPPYAQPGAPYQHAQQDRTGSGLATAALVLGVASPFLVFVCFTGVITAILSIVFGCVALARRAGKGRAIAGIVISVLSLVLFAIVAIWFWNVVQECAQLPGELADRCFEDRFPWMSGGR
ncbi:DUF4190 domain-containing protein [Nonomuraea basaltis]|uniref:DUF4190 domain-containing protein n=1 Tax=Nonomuraea basaltis TaxID=2495887 RepID=UPI00110C553E|nr:DUF4190 domain-containing protein [Nonomuraea basaltis]TMR94167.1 hypothetical protein EJK15_35220 [Nonomuraea basaltis]